MENNSNKTGIIMVSIQNISFIDFLRLEKDRAITTLYLTECPACSDPGATVDPKDLRCPTCKTTTTLDEYIKNSYGVKASGVKPKTEEKDLYGEDHVVDFGKHMGKKIREVPVTYIKWLLENTEPGKNNKFIRSLRKFMENK